MKKCIGFSTLDDEEGVTLVANELGLCNLRKMPCSVENL